MVEHTAEDPFQFCDGKWHKIQVWKDKTIVRMQVDDGAVHEGGGKGPQTSADIFDPLFAGGVPGRAPQLLQHKEHYLQNKTYTTYNTTYNTLLILHYLLHNTSLDYDLNTTFIQFVFWLHTYVPSKLQFETGFHLASSIFTLLFRSCYSN